MKTNSTTNNPTFTAGTHLPFWIDSCQPIAYSKLTENKTTDVIIIGGGISGVSIAYCLCKAGKKVVLVEDGYIGSGETGRTTAHLVTALDDRYYSLASKFGEEHTKLIAESHKSAIDFIERVVSEEGIDCDFERVKGYLFLHSSDQADSLDKELEAAGKAGLSVEKTNIAPGGKKTAALQFNHQAQFHPLHYLKALCRAIVNMGGEIYTDTHAKDIDHTGITTNEGFNVSAKHVVVATNSPVNNKYIMHLRQYAYRTYVIGAKIPKGSLEKALWWDSGNMETNAEIPPYHYVRTESLNSTHDLLMVGGEDHATGLADAEHIPEEKRYKILEAWGREHFPQMEDLIYKWSGQVMEPMDSLAYIGHNPLDKDNVYIVTGDSGNGMTHGTIAGLLISDLITGKDNPWKDLYSPSRFKLFKAGKTFFKEFVGGFVSYLKTKPKHLDSTGLKDLKPKEGKIIEFDGEKLGAYRDETDELHFVEVECTHLGCIVKWNNDEKSWDCPCHGSRFNPKGEVLNGPANAPLRHYSQHKDFLTNI